jgi:hypothetical protein
MNTLWNTKKPGEGDSGVADVSDQLGEPAVLVYDRPDWVKHPTTGAKIRVLAAGRRRMDCPSCEQDVTGHVITAEDPDSNEKVICCIDCPACDQFVWWTQDKPEQLR